MSDIGFSLPQVKPQVVNGRHPRSPIPDCKYINVFLLASHPDPKPFPDPSNLPEEIKKRVIDHLNAFESLFASQCGKRLKLRMVWSSWNMIGTSSTKFLKAEEVPLDLTKAKTILDERNKEKAYFPETDILVWYLRGDYISLNEDSNSTRIGRSFVDNGENPCALVLITEKAGPYTLAHEVGHILSNFSDPDPAPNDKGHNKNPDNLMYFQEGGTNITADQCAIFFKHKFIK
ncbi:hypothetical protein ACFWMP_25515 [Paenibacillus sp. NPDC058367]|uniref:hypothetical protein n=1 Tax=Paenibacillus sp. NPDC058367 TaxID=3346460 RepID=UPI00366106BB